MLDAHLLETRVVPSLSTAGPTVCPMPVKGFAGLMPPHGGAEAGIHSTACDVLVVAAASLHS